jgi:hypothetical protein
MSLGTGVKGNQGQKMNMSPNFIFLGSGDCLAQLDHPVVRAIREVFETSQHQRLLLPGCLDFLQACLTINIKEGRKN